ncbi:ATP-binding protein [Methylibium sp.]|uniref:ATP-binding protein n=1 Tax=Methylibium sp. TaxID=2067992 RepID=UPI001832308E|nr:ATP-binding protein [Methylibium sp.]MBA3590289.1 response regulator [Methylibium sp.]
MLIAHLPADEPQRLDCLLQLQVLDTPADPVLDGLVHCASVVSGCPIALVTLIDADRQWFKAHHGLDIEQTPREMAFCAHALLGDGLFEVTDALADPRFADNPLVLGAPHLRFYAGVPLEVDGHRLGTLCVIDRVPRRLTDAQRTSLQGLARAAQHWLLSHRQQIAATEQVALLRTFGETLPGFVYQFRLFPDGRFCFPRASAHVHELFELAPQDILHDGSALFARIHRNDLPGLHASIQASARKLTPWRHEFRVLLPRQGLRWHEGVSRPEPLPDGSVLWHGFVTDITERKQRDAAYREVQQRWQLAVDAARLGLIEIDIAQARVVLDANALGHHGLGADGASMDFDAWLALFEPVEGRRLRHAISTAGLDDGLMLTLQIVGADGATRYLELAARRLGDGDNGAACLVGACRDVSEQVQLGQLKRDKLAAEQASQAKSLFLSRVSHELRTPLNAILGFTQLLQTDATRTLDGPQKHRIEQVRHAGAHLLSLINDVLDLTRLDQGGLTLALRPMLLDAALDDAGSLVEAQALQRGVRIERSGPGEALAVLADARALGQVLVNLLSNGIKYNRAGGRLGVALTVHSSRIEIAVSDEGAGLSTLQQAELFQPFNRLGAENRGIEGSGLGLVIAKGAVEAMGGELRVTSEPGLGSVFSVLLPRASAAGLRAEPANTAFHATSLSAPIRGKPRAATILYIEDEPVNALLVVEALRGMPQWRVVVAPDGEQGLALARRLRPDVLLIDINIPRLTGDQVVRALRREAATRSLHCIALSADALPEQIAAARAAGFDDYWTKPLDLQQMVQRLRELLAELPVSRAAA